MIEFFSNTVFPWVLLNSVCGLIGGMILSDVKKTGVGILIGAILGLIGLFVVVLICQWERAKQLQSAAHPAKFDGAANQTAQRQERANTAA
jgi:uncharacterized membrane protein YeaQ/YmgE (transglycosylase-associated protein family)